MPTSADDLRFDANSNTSNAAYTVTVDATLAVKDLSFLAKPGDGLGGTITFTGSSAFVLSVAGNISLLSGMTNTFPGSLNLTATSGTQTITSNTTEFRAQFNFTGSGGTVLLADDITFTAPGARSLSLLASTTFNPNGKNFIINTNGQAVTLNTAWNFYKLTVNASATKIGALSLVGNVTVSNTLKYLGNSAINRVLIQSSVIGTPRTITAAAIDAASDFTDFMDITFANSTAPGTPFNVGTSIGNCLGNSGDITFTTPATQTATGTASFVASTHGWTTRVPLPQDLVIINNAFVAGRTITWDMPRSSAGLDMSGATGSPVFATGSAAVSIFGSLAGATGMTSTGTSSLFLAGRSSHTITSNGVQWPQRIFINGGGTYQLQDALVNPAPNTLVTLNAGGTLDANNFSLSSYGYGMGHDAGKTGAFLMGTGTWTATGSNFPWNMIAAGTMNITPSSSTIKFTDATAATKIFAGGSKSYNNLWLTGAGTGPFVITGSNTFNDLKMDTPPHSLQLTAGTVTTTGTFTVSGSAPGGSDVKFGRLFGVVNSSYTAPDSSTVSPVGDQEFILRVALDDWTPSAAMALIGHWLSTGNQRGIYFNVNANGTLGVQWTTDGQAGTQVTVTSSAAPTVSDGAALWLRVTLDVDNGAAGNDVKFYTTADADSPGAWVQLGTTRTTAGVTSIFNSSDVLGVGAVNTGTAVLLSGKVLRAQYYSGFSDAGGTLIADFNPNDYSSTLGLSTWTSSTTGEVWTKNGLSPIGRTNGILITSTSASNATLTKSGGGVISQDYLDIDRNTVTPTNSWYAGANSLNNGNNTNWNFTPPFTVSKGSFLQLFN